MRSFHLPFLLLCLLAVCASSVSATVYVNRDYYWSDADHQWHYNVVDRHIGTTTWGASSNFGLQGIGAPYVLEADVYVDNGGTLTIEPGVTVKVPPNRGIYVAGTLNAQGTSASHIVFTSTGGTGRGSWDEIMFWGASSNASVLRYCDISFAGRPENIFKFNGWHYAAGAIQAMDAAPTIDHCQITTAAQGFRGTGACQALITNSTFTNCEYGVVLNDTSYHQPFGPTPPISGNTITGCQFAAYCSAQAAGAFDANNNCTANTTNICRIYGGDIQNSSIWRRMNGGPVWSVGATVYCPAEKSLTIQAGNIVKMDPGRTIYVLGTLTAPGTSSQPISFTSVKDDSTGGDSNGDGGGSAPDKGDWGSLLFYGSASSASTMTYCTLKYGGFGENVFEIVGWTTQRGNLTIYSGAAPTFANCTSTLAKRDGAFLSGGSHPIFSNVQFTACGEYAVNCEDPGSNPVISSCSASGNGSNSIRIPSGTLGGARVWYKSIPYFLDGNVWLSGDASLMIQPGVAVKKLGEAGLYIAGNLQALGTQAEPIYFTSYKDDIYGDSNADGSATSPAPADWRELDVYGAATNSSLLRYCVVRYAGNGVNNIEEGQWHEARGNLHLRNTQAHFENCTFEYSGACGVYGTEGCQARLTSCSFKNNVQGIGLVADALYSTPATPLLTSSTFTNNGLGGYMSIQAANNFDASNTFTGNTRNAIQIYGSTVQTTCRLRRMGGAPVWWVQSTLDIPSGTSLTVDAGNVIKMEKGVSLNVMGKINAPGTGALSTIFTSIADDTAGGDTSHDGAATHPAPGDWESIVLFGGQNDSSSFSFCEMRYGSSGADIFHGTIGWLRRDGAVVIVECSPALVDCKCANSGVYGLVMLRPSFPALTRVQFTGGQNYAAYMSIQSNPTITNCSASSNSVNGIYVAPGTLTGVRNWYQSIPYVLVGHTSLDPAAEWTMLPGTVVKVQDGVGLFIYGKLRAYAEDYQSPIAFTAFKDDTIAGDTNGDGAATSPAAGSWRHIMFWGSGATPSKFRNVDVRYAGNNTNEFLGPGWHISRGNIMVGESAPVLDKCRIRYSGEAGIYCAQNSSPTITNCDLTNQVHGLYMEAAYPSPPSPLPIRSNNITGNVEAVWTSPTAALAIAGDNVITGNTRNAIFLAPGSQAYSGSWRNISGGACPYVVWDWFELPAGPSLTIEPGVTVKLNSQTRLCLRGTVDCAGQRDKRINFTSYKDDSFAGDTNGDASASAPAPKDWADVILADSAAKQFAYTRFRYGGDDVNRFEWGFWHRSEGNVYDRSTGAVFDHCEFSFSGVDGAVSAGSDSVYQSCTFAKNTRMGLYMFGDSDVKLNSCLSSANPYAAIQINPAEGGSLAASYCDLNGFSYVNSYLWDGHNWIWQWLDLLPASCFSQPPAFFNASGGDFGLTPGSPCIDTGDPAKTDFDGSRMDVGAYPFASDAIGASLDQPDGHYIKLNGRIVTAGTAQLGNRAYVEDASRSCGILIWQPPVTTTGQLVNVTGVLATIDGERAIIDPVLQVVTPSVAVPAPMHVIGRAFGGESPNAYTPGVPGQRGLYNIGLLVKISGTVSDEAPGAFWVDDGSGLVGEAGHAGIKVLSAVPAVFGSQVEVIGIASVYAAESSFYPVLRTRGAFDVDQNP